MNEFWNSRYDTKDFVYGKEPNVFLKEFLLNKKPGRILFPADGEGRNSVFAAKLGWECTAYDFSDIAKEKALLLAKNEGVIIDYNVHSHEKLEVRENYYDAVAMIFSHMVPDLRKEIHRKIIQSIKPGGMIILQGFSKKQIDLFSGGPKDINMLYSIDELNEDFVKLDILKLEEKLTSISEGSFHNGESWVVELIAKKSDGRQ